MQIAPTIKNAIDPKNTIQFFFAFLSLSFLLSTLSAIACPVVVRKFVPTSAAVCKSQSPNFMLILL